MWLLGQSKNYLFQAFHLHQPPQLSLDLLYQHHAITRTQPDTTMEIKHPRRILVLGSPDCDISRVVKGGYTSFAPT